MLDIRMKDENTSWQEWYEKNPRLRRQGVGVRGLTQCVGINDLDHVTLIKLDGALIYKCKYHTTWTSMLNRCYSSKWVDTYPSYAHVTVAEEFKRASSFKSWMETQITEDCSGALQLDKDILYPGNKTYSPSTCAFVPAFINNCIHICENSGGTLMRGVKRYLVKGGSFRYAYSISAACRNKVRKGGFISEALAHKEWQLARASVIEAAIEKYKLMDCYREDIAYAVKARADKLRYDAKFGLETKRLP